MLIYHIRNIIQRSFVSGIRKDLLETYYKLKRDSKFSQKLPCSENWIELGNGAVSVAVGFFNADLNQDLVIPNIGDSDVSILLGNGDGIFGPKTDFPAGSFPTSVAVGDFN